jgi:hypothetical protein
MESAALVQLAHRLLDDSYVLFGTIVADDDSSMRANMKWSNADWMINNDTTEPPRVPTKNGTLKVRPDRGQLRREYPEPGWLNDPSHRGKTLSGDLRSLEKQPLAILKGVNKVCRGSMDLWESIPQLYQSHYALEKEPVGYRLM